MAPENDVQVVSQFVLRARRVAAHSLAQSLDSLRELAGFKITGHITMDGTFTSRRKLPDEEIFESLAARVRPFTLASEPIYSEKVFKALHQLLKRSPVSLSDNIKDQLAKLKDDWSAIDLQGTGALAFWVQTERRDGSDRSPQVTDIQLAASWMYADLVHSNPTGRKREGLRFPIKQRYSAAVNVFSRLALLSLATHDAIMELHESGAIELDTLALESDVVVGLDELVEEGVAYVSQVNTPMPNVEAELGFPPRGWEQFTPTVLLRNDSRNQVEVVMTAADGSVVSAYDAAVSRRWHHDGVLHWAVLIAGVVTTEFAFPVEGEAVDIQFVGLVSDATTNRMKLADAKLQREMSDAEKVTFFVAGTPFFSFGIQRMEPEEAARVDISIDTLNDLTAIEALTRKPLAPLRGSYSVRDRVRLRQARLLLEGNLVPLKLPPLQITSARGITPRVVMSAEWSFTLGEDTSIPMPQVLVRHPLMQPAKVTEILDSDPPADLIIMDIPVREPFVAWVPDLVSVTDDEGLRQPMALGLSHLDEKELFGGEWDGSVSTEDCPS
jgi:hypothetical protein